MDGSVTPLVSIGGENIGNGLVDISLVAAVPGPAPGAGFAGFAALALAGFFTRARALPADGGSQ